MIVVVNADVNIYKDKDEFKYDYNKNRYVKSKVVVWVILGRKDNMWKDTWVKDIGGVDDYSKCIDT